jgi:hypothetical protein
MVQASVVGDQDNEEPAVKVLVSDSGAGLWEATQDVRVLR